MCLHHTPLSTMLVLENLEGGLGSGSAPMPAVGKISGLRATGRMGSGAQQLYRTSQCVEGCWNRKVVMARSA